jgi:hypothetical protein
MQIRTQEAQKHVDPVDPDPDSERDPQHCKLHVLFKICIRIPGEKTGLQTY